MMQNNKKTAIYTERCCIKPFEEADIDSAIPLFTDERVREFLGGVITEDAAREKLNKWIAPRSDNLYFSVALKSEEFIGVISVTTYLDTEKKEISYLFLPEHWGEGYAYESCAEIIAFCKQNLKCDTLIAETQKKNSRSRKLLERLGFSLVEEAERFGEVQSVYQSKEKNMVFAGETIDICTDTLDLCGKELVDITPIQDLPNLTYLALEENEIDDLSPLSGLVKLETLYLCHNRIKNVTPLKNLTNLKILSFWDNEITDISPLVNLTRLELLGLGTNRVADLRPLANMVHLVEIDLEHNQIVDVSPLTPLVSIQKLYLSDNLIENIEPLASLTNLTELGLYQNRIRDISPLFSLKKLTKLELSGNPISEGMIDELKQALPQCEILL